MNLVVNQLLDVQLIELEVKEEKEIETGTTSEETTMVLWDCITTLGLEEEESTEEIQLSAINITTRSQGPIIYEALLPKIKRFQESMKNIASKNQNPPIPEKVMEKKKAQKVSQLAKVVENKSDNNNKKISVEP